MLQIQSDRLLIRPFCRRDKEDFLLLVSDAEVMRYLEPPYGWEAAEQLFMEIAFPRKEEAVPGKSSGCEPPLIYAVEDGEHQFVGYVIYHKYEADSMEIGWVLKKSAWYRGYADELTKALVKDARNIAEYAVIECVPEQETTKRIALKNGFVYFGRSDKCDVYKRKLSGAWERENAAYRDM